jgi:hypothetical protein
MDPRLKAEDDPERAGLLVAKAFRIPDDWRHMKVSVMGTCERIVFQG